MLMSLHTLPCSYCSSRAASWQAAGLLHRQLALERFSYSPGSRRRPAPQAGRWVTRLHLGAICAFEAAARALRPCTCLATQQHTSGEACGCSAGIPTLTSQHNTSASETSLHRKVE
jgi:hypothetical protein